MPNKEKKKTFSTNCYFTYLLTKLHPNKTKSESSVITTWAMFFMLRYANCASAS